MTGAMTRPERTAWSLAAAGLVGGAIGWVVAPVQFAHAWLAAAVACSGWPLGSMILLLAHALTGGRWGDVLRPGLRAGVATLPLLLLVLVPLAWLLPDLYPWISAGAEVPNRWYLNMHFFAIRGGVYVVAWLGIAAAILFAPRLPRGVAALALIVLAVTVTFAAVDATMSLDPHFTSSIYGMLAAAGVGLLALSCAVLLSGQATAGGDIGKLLLALCVLWTYLDFMQILIVWQSDLVTQVPWYRARTSAGWGWVMALVSVLHSVIPIAILISPRRQRDRRMLVRVAILLVAAEVLRAWWTVLPPVAAIPGVIDVACVLGVAGLAAALALRVRSRGEVALA